jgi:hypothetical protein
MASITLAVKKGVKLSAPMPFGSSVFVSFIVKGEQLRWKPVPRCSANIIQGCLILEMHLPNYKMGIA